jgi:putative lipoprotein
MRGPRGSTTRRRAGRGFLAYVLRRLRTTACARPPSQRPRWHRRWRLLPPALLLAAALHLGPAAATARAHERDPWFGRDKALHYGASFTLALGGYALAAPFTPREPPRAAAGSLLALSLGVAKEIADRYTGGDPSWRDLGWDLLGTASGVTVAWLLDRFVF